MDDPLSEKNRGRRIAINASGEIDGDCCGFLCACRAYLATGGHRVGLFARRGSHPNYSMMVSLETVLSEP